MSLIRELMILQDGRFLPALLLDTVNWARLNLMVRDLLRKKETDYSQPQSHCPRITTSFINHRNYMADHVMTLTPEHNSTSPPAILPMSHVRAPQPLDIQQILQKKIFDGTCSQETASWETDRGGDPRVLHQTFQRVTSKS